MEPTGEHFSQHKTSLPEVVVNLDRYLYALKFLENKVVLDLGCGQGLGTYLYSMVAKKVYAVDYSAETLEAAKRFPFPEGKVEFLHLNLEKPTDMIKLPDADVAVALEVLEHLENPAELLSVLPANRLIFSVPQHSLEVSTWHKYNITSERDVRALIQPYFDIGELTEQNHPLSTVAWYRGEGVKYKS